MILALSKAFWLAFATAAFSASIVAQSHLDPSQNQILEFRDADRRYVSNAIERINELTSRHYGSRLRGEPEPDARLIQRLLDEGKIQTDQLLLLQSAGIALGDTLANQQRLKWVRFRDKEGVSRALLDPQTDDIIFPATMISRRFKVGLQIDVQQLYDKTKNFISRSRQIAAENY